MKKIKIAQIGTAHEHACVAFATLRRMTDVFDVVGYAQVPEDCGVIKESYYEGATKYTLEEIFATTDLDAVAIETTDLALVKYAQMSADRGLHVHMDKAPGESAEAFEKLLKTIKEKKLAFSIGYMYRFNPIIRNAFEKVKNGEIGTVYSIDADMSCSSSKGKREWLSQFQGGMMQFLGCHLIDLIVRLQGVPEEIIPYNYATGFENVNSKDVALALLKYQNGISTVRSSMIDFGGYVRRELVLHGDKGTIEIRPLEKIERDTVVSTKMTQYRPKDGWHGLGTIIESQPFDRYEDMLKEFASIILGKRSYVVDLETEARIHRCLLTACGIGCDYKGKIEL